MDQSLRCQPLEQQAGDGGDFGQVAAVQPAQLGDLRRGDGRAVGVPRVATQIDIHPLRLAVRLGAELAGERQGVGFQDDRELFLDFTNEGRLVALARLALAPRYVVDVLAVGAGAQQLSLLESQPGEFVDHGQIPLVAACQRGARCSHKVR